MPCKNPYLTRIWVCHQVKHADSLSNITQFPFMNHNTGLVLADWTAVMLATVYSRDATSVQATPLLFYTRADTPLSWLRAGWAAILIKPRDGDNQGIQSNLPQPHASYALSFPVNRGFFTQPRPQIGRTTITFRKECFYVSSLIVLFFLHNANCAI